MQRDVLDEREGGELWRVRRAMAEMKTDVWGRLFGGDAVKSIIRENKKERVNC